MEINRLTKFVSCISHGLLNISNGTIVNFIKELNTKSEYISIRNYSTDKYTLLVATKGKGKKYLEETNILNRYTGNLVHDHETVIYNYEKKHIECIMYMFQDI